MPQNRLMIAALLAFAAALAVPAPVALAEPPRPAADAAWRVAVESFARDTFKHPAWGYGHSLRVHALAKSLARADGVTLDDDVLSATAMLHDIAAFPPWFSADRDHSDRANEFVPAKLREMGFPEAEIPAVSEAIRTHFYDRAPVTPEARYIHDADALDWLGAVGAYRLIAIVETGGGAPDARAALAMLEQRLKQAPPSIVSRAGRREAVKRERSLRRFLDELRAQSADFAQL